MKKNRYVKKQRMFTNIGNQDDGGSVFLSIKKLLEYHAVTSHPNKSKHFNANVKKEKCAKTETEMKHGSMYY